MTALLPPFFKLSACCRKGRRTQAARTQTEHAELVPKTIWTQIKDCCFLCGRI